MKFSFEKNKDQNISVNSQEKKLDELAYFFDEKGLPQKIKELLIKQESIKDKDSIEFKELQVEIINLRFKKDQAETYRDLYDDDFSQEQKDDEVESLRKKHLKKIIAEIMFRFYKYNKVIAGNNSSGTLELYLAKRELYGETPELKLKIEEIINSFKKPVKEDELEDVPKFGFIHKRLQDMDENYLTNFYKDGYKDKLLSDIEERKKEGYVYMKDKNISGNYVGVRRLDDGRIDYSSSAKMN